MPTSSLASSCAIKADRCSGQVLSAESITIKFRISYKILLLTFKALNGLAPTYLTSLLSCYNPSRSLRLQISGLWVVPRILKSTKGGRAFSHLAPKLWDSLPYSVRGLDTSLWPRIHIMYLTN